MITVFDGQTADDIWRKILSARSEGLFLPYQSGRGGTVDELLHVGLTVRNPRQRWIVSRTPPINPAFSIVEIVWIMTGRNDSGFINYFNSKYAEFAGYGDTYHGAYGYRLKKHFNIDQLERAYISLKNNPDSRQVVLQIWDCRIDLPDEDGKPVNQDIPCNVISMVKVRNGFLEWTQIIRSNDLFLGLPYNIIQFTTIQEIIAGWLGLRLGSYNQFSDSLHVYKRNINDVFASSPITVAENTDIIDISKKDSDLYFGELARRIDTVAKDKIGTRELRQMSAWSDAPSSFKNMLLIICAETARRKRWHDESSLYIDRCNNPIFVQLWERWATGL